MSRTPRRWSAGVHANDITCHSRDVRGQLAWRPQGMLASMPSTCGRFERRLGGPICAEACARNQGPRDSATWTLDACCDTMSAVLLQAPPRGSHTSRSKEHVTQMGPAMAEENKINTWPATRKPGRRTPTASGLAMLVEHGVRVRMCSEHTHTATACLPDCGAKTCADEHRQFCV